MENAILFIIIGVCAVTGILILAFLICCAIYQRRIRSIYKEGNRDERFAGALLGQVFGDRILKKPYLLRDDSARSPRADLIYVCSGGVAVISVLGGSGLFSAPENGQWRQIENGEMKLLDNLLDQQQAYLSEISALLVKNSLRCPAIRGYVFLTDDQAEVDYLSSDSVLTGSRLIAALKEFDGEKRLKSKDQKAILEMLAKNSRTVRQTLAFRQQREIAVPDPEDESDTESDGSSQTPGREDQPEESPFDFSDLIRIDDSADSPETVNVPDSTVRILTEQADGDESEE